MRLIKQDLYKKKIMVFFQVHEGSTEKATELLHTDKFKWGLGDKTTET